MIQLVFDAADAREALARTPSRSGTAHTKARSVPPGTTRSWRSSTGRTRSSIPPRAPTRTSSAAALYLGSSAEAGVGCDDTLGPHVDSRPAVKTIPSDPAAARAAYPWIAFEGRWGELQKAFFNGPTGPNMKTQWTRADRRGRRAGATGAMQCRPEACSEPAPPTSSAAASRRVKGTRPAAAEPGAGAARDRGDPRSRRLRRRPRNVDPERAAPDRAPSNLGSDPLGVGAHVRGASPPGPRHRAGADPACVRDHCAAVARVRGDRPGRHGHGRGSRCIRAACRCDRDDAGPPRAGARPGCGRLRARRDRRRPLDRAGGRVSDRARKDPPAARRDRDLRRRLGRAHGHRGVDPRRDLARGAMVPARAGHRARGPLRSAGASPRRAALEAPLVPGRIAGRSQRRDRAGRRDRSWARS